MIKNEIFRDVALSQVPRILGLQDRNPSSATFGCFDRYYWHYRLLDVCNARFQEGSLLLALLYKSDFENNPYFNNARIYDWFVAGLNFSETIQHKDGSLDEVYPNEQSFVATSFLVCALSESLLVLDDIELCQQYLPMLERSAKWLGNNCNLEVLNQMAGSSAAMLYLYKLTEKEEYNNIAHDKIEKILSMQDDSGYFSEYGGWDLGYLSISIAYLTKIIRVNTDEKIADKIVSAVSKAISFTEERVDETGNYDQRKSSRNTQYLYPSGFVRMGSNVVDRLREGLLSNKVLNPAWMDDRFCIPLTIDYLQAFLESNDGGNDQ